MNHVLHISLPVGLGSSLDCLLGHKAVAGLAVA